MAAEAGTSLLWVDLSRWPSIAGPDFDDLIRVLLREALFQGAMLYLEPWDALYDSHVGIGLIRETLLDELSNFTGIAILAGERAWEPVGRGPRGVVSVQFEIPSFEVRRDCWQAQAAENDFPLTNGQLDALATLYRLTPEQIADAAATVAASCPSIDHFAEPAEIPSDILYGSARAQSGQALARLVAGLTRSTAGTT